MTPAVEVKSLSVDFGEHRALTDISLSLPAGAFLTIVGPNGSGKSSFLKVLLGLLRASAGTVRLFGKSTRQVPPEWIGYVPQIKTLDRSFPAVARELVATGLLRRWPLWMRSRDRARVREALETVGAPHLANRGIGQLSGGELQRVYLARALVRRPKLVVLDEPATGVDVAGEQDFYHLLEHYHEETGATVLMVTHDWAAAFHHATHVLLLKSEQIGFGEPEAVLAEENMRQAFGHVGHVHEHKRSEWVRA